jgi:hypothetical protein
MRGRGIGAARGRATIQRGESSIRGTNDPCGRAVLTQTPQPTREEERRGQTRVFDDKMCNRIWAVKLSSGTRTELCMHTA